jgi:hypothetical protein
MSLCYHYALSSVSGISVGSFNLYIAKNIINCRHNGHLLSPSLSLMLQPTVSRPVCLGIKHPSGAYDQIFVNVRQLRVCSCGALSLTRGRVFRLQLLLDLASAVILGSESRGTRNHILLSQIRDFPFRRLLRLAGLRWRYSIPPPHGSLSLISDIEILLSYFPGIHNSPSRNEF